MALFLRRTLRVAQLTGAVLARPQSDAGRQTRHGVTHLLELRLVIGKRRARLGVSNWRQQVSVKTAHVPFCGNYDTQNEDSVALSPRCVDGDGVRRRGLRAAAALQLLRIIGDLCIDGLPGRSDGIY